MIVLKLHGKPPTYFFSSSLSSIKNKHPEVVFGENRYSNTEN